MTNGRDLLVLHIRDERPRAPGYQRLLDELNRAAMRAFDDAGWAATLLPVAHLGPQEVLDRARGADAVVIMGGEDVDPQLYGGALTYPGSGQHEPEADRTMIAVIRQSLDRRSPLLGICRGHQLINVALGGTLVEHMVGHRSSGPSHFVSTSVEVAPDEPEPAAFAVGEDARCSHHQAVRSLGDGLRVVARADDGTIEAIAHRKAPLLGVQWHPEHPDVAGEQLATLLDHCVDRAIAAV
ncbi:gamma-glutamyl-gamma-aminobutyrate hydrolase family protein [Microbacterium immunditiarum]|uniref:Putative glutamine amidotransferase n=1 Tax=Microbacterium immunditiarum TaxID=337480 RepID=A0A7Y9KK87_9MICO|nr:gamma-glutamyl-gamma-aminobutyrate hydrolase family protein [Microbacterium immunditiarum]NYE20560.1 putative glutamine amidotransferase [Microbacterium immunditiarum]